MEDPKLQGTGPKRKRRFGATFWFGNPRFIDSKISGQYLRTRGDDRSCHCAGNVTAKDAKHTKRNPRRRDTSRATNPTGDNGENRGSNQSLFPPLPPVQKSQSRSLMPNDSATAAMRRGDWNISVMPRLCHARGSRAKWLVEETKPLLKSQGSPTSHRGIEFNPVFCSGETFPAHPLVRNRYKKLNSLGIVVQLSLAFIIPEARTKAQ